jgi:hypothetical protein
MSKSWFVAKDIAVLLLVFFNTDIVPELGRVAKELIN